MSCNSCAKPYSFLRKEKACPNCGFGYCSKCLDSTLFVPKLNAEAKVCRKCKKYSETHKPAPVEPPDAYFKRLGIHKSNSTDDRPQQDLPLPQVDPMVPCTTQQSNTDHEILNRLQKLKEGKELARPVPTEDEIKSRLNKIKGETPKTTDKELQERLGNLRGVPITSVQNKPFNYVPDTRTEQEQADDLMKQYLEQSNIDNTYRDEFDALVSSMEARLTTLKGSSGTSGGDTSTRQANEPLPDSEDEEDAVRKIVAKMKAEASLEVDELPPSTNDELPFCEICNEDATMRCLGCKYLFCKRCFLDHKDDDDGCYKYEPYTPPKNSH